MPTRYAIKNWKKFQHFKDRRPPWIKLYRDILEDPDWHQLDDKASKVLVMLWILASEDEEQKGQLPCLRKIAFRLRMPEKPLESIMISLRHWIDIIPISNGYQVDTPEAEREAEDLKKDLLEREREAKGETTFCSNSENLNGVEVITELEFQFTQFWKAYPKKQGKGLCWKWWKKHKPSHELLQKMLTTIKLFSQSDKWVEKGGQYVPMPSTWLNQERWDDELPTKSTIDRMQEQFNRITKGLADEES